MDLALIGYFSKTHGVKGHLILREDAIFEPGDIKAIFVESGGSKAPYFVSAIRETANGLMIKLEDVDAVEKARLLIGKEVYADAQFVEEDTAENVWQGYVLVDKRFGELGLIVESSDNGTHELVNIIHNGQEIILPLVDEFIERVEEDTKRIFYKAPDGLIELYLDNSGDEKPL